MKKLSKWVLSIACVLCFVVGMTACGGGNSTFSKPDGFKFDESSVTVSFDAVDGAESYNVKIAAADGTSVYENATLTETKIALKDKNLTAGRYTATVRVNATSEFNESEISTFGFEIKKVALAAPANLAKEGDSVTWSAVDGATNGYSVRIYNKQTTIEVVAPVTLSVTEFSTVDANELVNAQTETLTYVIEVKALATDNNLESAVATVEWVVKGKILKPSLSAAATEDGTLISWIADNRATAGYKAELYKGDELKKEYSVTADAHSVEIDRNDALKGEEYTLKVYGVATDDLRAGDVAEIKFTQSLPQINAVENLAVNGTTASWDAVDGATAGYSVTVYRKGNEGNVKLDAKQVAQSENPSIDLSALAYAAEKEYVVSVTVNAVESEYIASESVTAEYRSGAVWTFADEEDKDAFISHGPEVKIADGKLVMSEPRSGANVVVFKHHFNAGDKITIQLKTKRVCIYGNSKTDNAAHVVKAFICDGKLPDQVGWNEESEKEGTLVLTVAQEIEGLFMDLDAANNLSVTIERLEIEEKTELFGDYIIYSGKGATARTTESGTLEMQCTDTTDKCATVVTPEIKANSVIEVTYGNVTSQDGGDGTFFIYGINASYDTYLVNDITVLRRNGYTNDINTETVGGNKTAYYTVDRDIYGLRFDFASVGTTVEVESIRIIEPKTTFDFVSENDVLWFAADYRVTDDEKQMTLSVAENDGDKALNVKSVDGSNMLIFSYQLKTGSKITIDLKSKACFVYGKPATSAKDLRTDMDVVGEVKISNDQGTRNTVTLDVNADCVGIYIMFNAEAHNDPDGSFIYSITITPPQE